jgi:hypothetical protein
MAHTVDNVAPEASLAPRLAHTPRSHERGWRQMHLLEDERHEVRVLADKVHARYPHAALWSPLPSKLTKKGSSIVHEILHLLPMPFLNKIVGRRSLSRREGLLLQPTMSLEATHIWSD